MRAYVLINASAGKAIEVARSLQGVKGIELADAITGEYDVIAAVEAPDVAGIGSALVGKNPKNCGGFKTVRSPAPPSQKYSELSGGAPGSPDPPPQPAAPR